MAGMRESTISVRLAQHQRAEQRRHHRRDVRAAGFQRGTAHNQRGDKVKLVPLDG